MRTTLDLDEKLLEGAMKASGVSTKTATIHYALEQVIRKANFKRLMEYGGKIPMEYNVRSSRGRD